MIDDNYLKLSGGTVTGHIILSNAVLTSQYQAISRSTGNAFFVQITNPYVYHQFNMVKNKIINLGDPTDATDAVNKQYLEKSHVKPSHYNNEFKYLMTNRLAWTDLEPNNIGSFNITKIDNLMPQDGNYHQYNHKVLYTTIIKDKQGGYSYKMGINCYQLDKDKDYTLCTEILIQITNYGINQLLELIKPHQRGYQLLVLRYKSFLTGTQIVVGTLHICIISK